MDNINGQVLIDALVNPIFATEFCNIMNEMLRSGQIPDDWKISTIVPIEKVKNAKKAEDFRPINMLPVYEKILEITVKNQINKFLNSNKVLIEEQAGFRNNFSCESALNKVLSDWKSAIEEKKIVLCVFLNFKRAFETIDREILLKKLELYGFGPDVLKFFSNYLSCRKQLTKFKKTFSNEKICDIGLPQGSVLSPLLFILYVNDVTNVVMHSSVNLFADDTLLYVVADSLEEATLKMNEDLEKLNGWLNFNKLALNVNKTKAMIISLKSNLDTENNIVKISNEQIDYVDDFKYLGFWLDKRLDFNKHLDYIEKKMLGKYHMLKNISRKLNANNLDMLYKSLISPHIDYCSSVLFLFNDSQMEKLQKIQNRMMRLILKAPWDTHIADMLNRLGWLSIKQRIYFNTMKFIYKIENDLETPEYLKKNLVKRKEVTNHNLRRKSAYCLPNFLMATSRNSLNYKGIKLYNEFKEIHGHITNMNQFCKACVLFIREKV